MYVHAPCRPCFDDTHPLCDTKWRVSSKNICIIIRNCSPTCAVCTGATVPPPVLSYIKVKFEPCNRPREKLLVAGLAPSASPTLLHHIQRAPPIQRTHTQGVWNTQTTYTALRFGLASDDVHARYYMSYSHHDMPGYLIARRGYVQDEQGGS